MARLRSRRSLALLTIALVIFAAFVPAVAASLPAVVLVPLWAILPTVSVTLLRRQLVSSDEECASLLSLVVSRAPPTSAS